MNPLHHGVVDTLEAKGAASFWAAARTTVDDPFESVQQR
jgi:hypothetical protein